MTSRDPNAESLPPIQPIWLPFKPERGAGSALTGHHKTRTVVIGGGIVGILTAWRMAERGQDVALLEEAELLNGDTGFTTSFVTRVPDVSLTKLVTQIGIEKVKQVWQAASEAQAWLRNLVQTEQIDCDWVDCASYIIAYAQQDQKLKDEFAVLQQLDPKITWVTKDHDPNIPQGAVAAIRIPGEAHMQVRKLLFGLLRRPAAKRIKIYENSKVVSYTVSSDAVHVTTPQGQIEAQQVFICTGRPGLVPELAKQMQSFVTYVIAAEYPSTPPISNDIFWDTDEPYQYFRRVNDTTMLLGGADHIVGEHHDPDASHRQLVGFLEKHLAGFKRVTHRWSGSIHATSDGLPAVGWLPGTQRVGVATGLLGSGMVYGTTAAILLTDLANPKTSAVAEIFSPSRYNLPAVKIESVPAVPSSAPSRKVWQWTLPLIPIAALVFAWSTFLSARGGWHMIDGLDFKTAALLVFPVFGLTAFTLVWTQLMLGSLMSWLRHIYPGVERYHRLEGPIVLFFMTLHPLTIFVGAGLSGYFHHTFIAPSQVIWLWFSYTALFLAYGTVITALLRKWKYVQGWWRKVHVLNYVVFWAAWIHSWNIGSDIRTSGLKYVWLFFALTGAMATVRRFWPRRAPSQSPKTATTTPDENFVKVATLSQITPDKPFCCTVQQRQIALFNLDGKIYALDNICNHAEGPLCEGFVDGNVIECPLHASRFDIRTGALIEGPATKAQSAFKVRMNGEDVEIAF